MKNLFSTILVGLFLVANLASAQYYDERPSVLNVEAKDFSNEKGLPKEWKKANYGHFVLLAEIVTFFPENDYYMLARDIEYLYDIAALMFKDNPKMRKRIHLVPISTELSSNKFGLVPYLQQEGLNEKSLGTRGAVFIDSCCSGSVPTRIINTFSKILPNNRMQGFLIRADAFPSSVLASSLGADGLEIEGLPHYTGSGKEYDKTDQGIRILARPQKAGTRTKSEAILQQIRFDYDNEEARTDFKELVKLMRIAYSYLVENSGYKAASREQAIAALNEMAAKFEVSSYMFVRDIRNMKKKKYAKVNFAKVDEFLKDDSAIKKGDVDAFAMKLLFNPEQEKSMSGLVNSISDLSEVKLRALTILADSQPQDLELTKKEYNSLILEWLERLNKIKSFGYYEADMQVILARLRSIALSPSEAMAQLIARVKKSGIYNLGEKLPIALIETIAKDGYKLKSGSALEFYLNETKFNSKYSDEFNMVMENVMENAPESVVRKISKGKTCKAVTGGI